MKSLVIVAALTGVASADQIDAPAAQTRATYSFDVASHVRWLGDTSGAIVADDALAGVRMTLGRSLGRIRVGVVHRDVEVGVFARWVYAAATGTMFGNLDTALDQHLLGGGVRLDAKLISRLRVVGQAELGYARTGLTVTQDEMTPADDQHWSPYGTATLGADLGLVQRPRFRLGLGIDLGYTVTVPVKLHALPGDRPDEDLSIPTEFASIGKLDTRGVTYSMALRGSF